MTSTDIKKIFLLIPTLLLVIFTLAQHVAPKGWHLQSPNTDSMHGISLNAAYQFLKNKKSTPVIVAVIDGGIDTAQEDLKNVLWHNPKEVQGNGIDDDHNGYIDDVYGWNFLGSKDTSMTKTSEEKVRMFYQYKPIFENKQIDKRKLTIEKKELFQQWKAAAQAMKVNEEEVQQVFFLEMMAKAIREVDSVIQKAWNTKEYTAEDLEKYQSVSEDIKKAKATYIDFVNKLGINNKDMKNTELIDELDKYISGRKEFFDLAKNPPPNYRAQIVKDDVENINDIHYGNNNVMVSNPVHGTHVSGIIAAQRNNGIGIDGIADNVKIMTIRAVPDGDEYDKDVALAIRYAVDNGAKVVNMSFGKYFSPHKKWVDDAVRYAAEKDVLLVHAAGNNGKNTDSARHFPTGKYFGTNIAAPNFIDVGASSDMLIDSSIIAGFSNYGKFSVDVFAPGSRIYATLPFNKYTFFDGTSMASPVVAGIAALIRSYFPKLTASQVKSIIIQSVDTPSIKQRVVKPGTKSEIVSMSTLCKSKGIVNAEKAVKLAAKK